MSDLLQHILWTFLSELEGESCHHGAKHSVLTDMFRSSMLEEAGRYSAISGWMTKNPSSGSCSRHAAQGCVCALCGTSDAITTFFWCETSRVVRMWWMISLRTRLVNKEVGPTSLRHVSDERGRADGSKCPTTKQVGGSSCTVLGSVCLLCQGRDVLLQLCLDC